MHSFLEWLKQKKVDARKRRDYVFRQMGQEPEPLEEWHEETVRETDGRLVREAARLEIYDRVLAEYRRRVKHGQV